MRTPIHQTAKPSHYNKESEAYDLFNEKNALEINQTIAMILSKYKVKSVLDATCGTGSQVFYLAEQGYDVVGADISAKMLKIAKAKSEQKKLNLRFMKKDIRTVQAGQFDAVISIFNAIGHLTKADFELAIQNIYSNLHPRGLYIFDIFNLNYLLDGDNITRLTIDWQKKSGNITAREIQYSIIDQDGVLASYDIYHEQVGSNKPNISKAIQTLQVYSAEQLKQMLARHGFKVLRQCDIDGARFYDKKSERILTIAQKL